MLTRTKISVALASYNGAAYLAEQLESIAGQSRPPDELIISDDASTDETASVIRRFAEDAPFDVQLIANTDNVGYTANFERALARCEGDVIFLCDQDDIWLSHKIERMIRERSSHPEALLLMSDAGIVNRHGVSSGQTVIGNLYKSGSNLGAFTKGCCMTIDRALLDLALPLSGLTSHDTWISWLAVRLGTKRVIGDVLLKYRVHGGNVSAAHSASVRSRNWRDRAHKYAGGDTRANLEARIALLDMILDRVCDREPSIGLPLESDALARARKMTREELAAVRKRARLLERSRPSRFYPGTQMLLLGEYRHFSGLSSYTKDLLRP